MTNITRRGLFKRFAQAGAVAAVGAVLPAEAKLKPKIVRVPPDPSVSLVVAFSVTSSGTPSRYIIGPSGELDID